MHIFNTIKNETEETNVLKQDTKEYLNHCLNILTTHYSAK